MIFIFEEIITKGFWDWIETIATILGNIGLFIITFYVFWKQYFSKNIKITSSGEHSSIYFGNAINCTLFNKTLSPVVVEKIDVVYDNKYEVTIKDFKENPLVLEYFRSAYIKGERYTSLSEKLNTLFARDVYYKVKTPDKTILIKSRGKIKKKNKLTHIATFTQRFDDTVISKGVRYVLIYWLKGTKEFNRVFILDNGMMDKNIANFNQLPREILGKPKEMLKFFKETFNNPDLNIRIHEL